MELSIQDWGAVGEIIGAMGIVFTLGYLALQIRQANSIANWETHRSAVTSNSRILHAVISDADTARVFRDGLLDLETLDPVDRVRLHGLLNDLVLNFKDTLDAYDRGLFDRPTYEAWQAYICSIMKTPSGRIYWQENAVFFIARVREVIDEGILEVPSYDSVSPSFWMSGSAKEVQSPNPKRSTFSE